MRVQMIFLFLIYGRMCGENSLENRLIAQDRII